MWRFHKEAKEKEKEPTETKILEQDSSPGGMVGQPTMNHMQPPVAVDNP